MFSKIRLLLLTLIVSIGSFAISSYAADDEFDDSIILPGELLPVGSLGFCGNHDLDAGEQCDDGNTSSGDGCDSVCQIEEIQVVAPSVPVSPTIISRGTTYPSVYPVLLDTGADIPVGAVLSQLLLILFVGVFFWGTSRRFFS